MNALRELRQASDLSQQECAALIDVPVNTFRMWDSGLRPIPLYVLQRVTVAVGEHARNTEPLSLDQLGRELGVHQRTLRAAARTGRLQVTFSSRSAFGRPIRLATRAAGQAFMRRDYRRYGGQSPAVAPLPSVPDDYDMRLKRLRRRLRLTQHDLARRIGAAGKAVIDQWESRKSTPSPVLWQQVLRLPLVGSRTTVSNRRVAASSKPMRAADCPQAPPDLTRLRFAAEDIPGPAEPSIDRV
jgi:DNA-binding transcriptional regulator YiaG